MPWNTPKTDFVNGDVLAASEMNAIGQNLAMFNGGTTGQALAKSSNSDGAFTWSSFVDLSSAQSLSNKILVTPEELTNIVASAATGTINIDANTAAVWYYTSNATANFTLNFRASSSVTMNTRLAVGEAVTLVFMNTNGATAYLANAFQIDGTSQTILWQGGTAPSTGNANSIDVYTFTIIKTAATPTYVVLGAQTRFA